MCATCGCSDDAGVRVAEPGHPAHEHGHSDDHDHTHNGHGHPHEHSHHGRDDVHAHGHEHAHEHSHPHEHSHEHVASRTVTLEQEVLAKNDLRAERNRGWLSGRGILAVNLMSSPGAGKTTLLECTVTELAGAVPIGVIEGDQETLLDADRIKATGAPVVQINTGAGCHLDAGMLERGLTTLEPSAESVLFIENVGNLVCPALFDLGEATRVVIVSVTEGQDKPLKYPNMFAEADLVLLNKIDLLPYLDFDVDAFERDAAKLNPAVEVLHTSATRGDGVGQWCGWLRQRTGVAPATTSATGE